MLYDLRCPAGILLAALLPAAVIVFDFNILIAGRLPDTGKRQAALFRLIGRIFPDDHRIVHYDIQDAHVDDNDPLLHTDYAEEKTMPKFSFVA